MKKRFILAFAFVLPLLVSPPAHAQALTDAQCNVVKAIDAKFPALNKGSDDDRRVFARRVAEQFAFSFPGEGWGSKDAGGGRPPTKDVVARLRNGVLDGWELVDGASRSVKCNDHITLDGQHFIAVQPIDYLSSAPPPPPPPPPGDFVTHAEARATFDELSARLVRRENAELDLNKRLSAVETNVKDLLDAIVTVDHRLTMLEDGKPGTPAGDGSAAEQLAVTKQILELLKKAALRLGIQQ